MDHLSMKSYTTGTSISKLSNLLGSELRNNLETKLAIYELFRGSLPADGVVIFTSRPEIWKTDELRPFIITSQPLPPIPSYYDPRTHDIARDVINFFRKMTRRKEEYLCTYVTLFVLPRNEVHILLSNIKTIGELIETYIKIPIPYSAPPHVTIRALTHSAQNVHKIYIEDLYVGVDSRERRRQLSRKVGFWLMSAELKRNLNAKVEKFVKLIPYEEDTAVIFELAPSGIWPKELKFVLINHPPPPLPNYGNDDYKENIIPRYILEYVKQVAKMLNCAPFYAAYNLNKFKYNGEWHYHMHLLFSQHRESLRGVTMGLTTEDPPAKLMVRMPMYSSESYTEWYSKIGAFVNVQNQKMLPAACEADDPLEPYFDSLFSKEMKEDITNKVELFWKDEEARKGMPVLFVNAPEFWPRDLQFKVIPDNPLTIQLPRNDRCLADQRKDVDRAILNYAKYVAMERGYKPFYASCSKLGLDICFEAHLLFSQSREAIMLASRWGCATSEDPPPPAKKKDPSYDPSVPDRPAGRDFSWAEVEAGRHKKPTLDEDLKKNLDYKVKLFLSGAPYKKDTVVVFSDDFHYWPAHLNFVLLEDPPPFYSYNDFTTYQDVDTAKVILDYVKERAELDGCVPFYASCSKEAFHMTDKIQVMFSNFKKPILATSARAFTTEDPPDPSSARDFRPIERSDIAGPSTEEAGQSVESQKKKKTLLEKLKLKMKKTKSDK